MSKRLQVILQDAEYRQIKRLAQSRHLSIAAWVRQALAVARRKEPLGDGAKKLDIIRAAARHSYPTADIEPMLDEIERGYRTPETP